MDRRKDEDEDDIEEPGIHVTKAPGWETETVSQKVQAVLDSLELEEPQLRLWQGVCVLAERGRVRIASGELEAGVSDMLEADRRMAVGQPAASPQKVSYLPDSRVQRRSLP